MIEPEKKEEGDADQDRRLEEAKKAADTTALTLITLGASGCLFWVMNLAVGRWNVDLGQDALLALVLIACQPIICLVVRSHVAQPEYVEKVLMVSAVACLAAAVVIVGGLQTVHVARHGMSHWGCLSGSQTWLDRHPDIQGTVAAYRCGAESCTWEQALDHKSPRMVVEFDRRAWYEVRIGPAADCRTVAFDLKPGGWLPNLGGRVAAAPDVCHSILPRADASWHPIR